MSHRYIVSSTPYIKLSGRPIYKVPPRGNPINPYRWQPGPLVNLIQISEEQNSMLDIIITPPQEDVEVAYQLPIEEDVDSTQEQEPGTIVITMVEEEVREPVKTRKIRVGNKVKIVPIE